jgi:hypothetical protein
MPGPMPRAPREFHRWLVQCAIGVFLLLALYEGFAFVDSGRSPTSLGIALLGVSLAVALIFYLRWFMRRSANLR